MEIGPGDRVLCVGPIVWYDQGYGDESPPSIGGVYTIREVYVWEDLDWTVPVVLLHEIVNPIHWYGDKECECPFPLDWFRKWRGNEFDDLLNVRELEDA